ncbi:MAG: transposase [Chloroflexi bacterium]|nr:transposase [Chloroflexota bacterium]
MHPILGIDIGKEHLFVGFLPEAPDLPPRTWRSVVKLAYADRDWWKLLLDLIADDAVVAAEPTGHHLLAPVANVIHTYRPAAQVWQVDHRLAEHVRETHVASAKNDRLDAIALCLIARDIAAGQPPRQVRRYDYFTESAVQRLRMLVNARVRLVKENTRTKNRLHVLAHSLFPAFAGSPTWLRAAQNGYITPAQLKQLAALEPTGIYADGRVRRPLFTLAADLPDIDADPHVVAAILDEIERQRFTDQQLATLDAQIRQVIEADPFAVVTRRWRTVPNANDFAIAALHVASLGRARDYTIDEFKAACGVSPHTNSSGGIDKTRLTRRGYQPVRAALHMWAVSMVSPTASENAVRTYYQAVETRTFAAAKNKLARVLWGTAARPNQQTLEQAGEFPPA